MRRGIGQGIYIQIKLLLNVVGKVEAQVEGIPTVVLINFQVSQVAYIIPVIGKFSPILPTILKKIWTHMAQYRLHYW